MDSKETFYPESRFGGFTDVDGTVAFFNRINSLLQESSVVLDVGCGRGAYGEYQVILRRKLRILKGKVAKIIGIDVDPVAGDNPFLDEFRLITESKWPIDDCCADLIVCDNVLEHIDDPERFFVEIARTLKNGGYLCVRTPNRWGYIALAATLIPNRYHSKVTSIVQVGRKEEDVFPTVYRCNSIRKMRRMMRRHGFAECVVYGHSPEPSYFAFSKIAYFLGVLHQKFAPNLLKPTLFAFGKMQKPGK